MSQININDLIGVNEGGSEILGKLLYFSLSNILVERGDLQGIIEALNVPLSTSSRDAVTDAFKSATGDVYNRFVAMKNGRAQIYKVYYRDNNPEDKAVLSRELVKETLESTTNTYEKLANVTLDKKDRSLSYNVCGYDSRINVSDYHRQTQELFDLYRTCYGRKQIEHISENFLRMMDSLKIGVHGRLHFVPKKSIQMVDVFEDFIDNLNQSKKQGQDLTVNSIYVINSAKQRDKMTAEFYSNVKKDIEAYQERVSHLINSGSESAVIMDRWVNKVLMLEIKKQEYEALLQRELCELDDEFNTLRFLSQELQIRAKKINLKKCA
jgi:hypothetical protein